MTKKRIRITDGGIALPLGNNTFLMRGRLHSQGGIGIGNGGKNDIEVEDGEVVKFNKNNIQVLSDQPMLNGISPANALLAGGNFNKIFKAQQSINGDHHGSYGENGLIKKLVGLLTGSDNKKENTYKAEPLNLEELKLRQAYAESGFDSNARSNKDAVGLFQIRENLLTDYNNAHGTNYTLEDLYDDKLNMSVRDWKMDKNLASDWAIRNNAPDSVVYAKSLGGYNMGNQNFLNYLGKAKAAGVDIYNSMDWISEKWLPKETVDYINFILRNQNNSPSRNNAAYELNKRKNSDKVEGIRKGFKEGGEESIKDIIRQKIYHNIIPVGYEKPIRRIFNALLDKGDFLFNGERPIDENGNIWGDVINYRDDIFAEYLQIPENKRRDFEGRAKLVKSNYTPTIKTDNNDIYYKLDENSFPMDDFIRFNKYDKYDNEHTPLKLGESRITSTLPFGYNTVSRGFDNNGEYISYYDEWDLSPFNNKDGHNSNKKDNSFGIGKPVYLYNRLYLDDYYGVPEEYRGSTYLPEVEVLPNDENYKNGGQINMKLKHKNKQDITDRVMKEILPHSTGERKKFVLGGSEWSLLGNIGANILNGFTQGIIGSINSSRLGKLYDSMKRKSTYVPVAREHIDTRVDIQPQLTSLKQAEHTLIENANANTSNSKVARQQARTAVANRIQQEHTVYGAKHDKEHSLRTAEGQLQTQYNLADAASLSADIKDQNDFDMMKIMGKANAKTAEAQAWGQGMANMLQGMGNSLMDYSQMNTDLLKSNNPQAYDQWFSKEYGHLKGKVTDQNWIKKNQGWFDDNKVVLERLGWITI